jgi:broad specificity phosphatase PhoE
VVNWDIREWAHKTSGYTRRVVKIPNRHKTFPEFFTNSEPEEYKQKYESKEQLLSRVINFINELKKRGGQYVIISHGMVIYTMIYILNGIFKVPVWDKKILNTSVTWYENDECKYFAKFVNSGQDPRSSGILMK